MVTPDLKAQESAPEPSLFEVFDRNENEVVVMSEAGSLVERENLHRLRIFR